ncbi:polysaccharide lyase 6 family protein [Paenibacillus sp. 32352]|uniref:polysaccharide lyase 6 family protein n=1 Tax=Paenibacillus sp. 32352 TaxID=1969111 RepID=UPI0015C4423A|nr:polysaccharide lyase 6 family protein [Paenibacillus sp. 32352]
MPKKKFVLPFVCACMLAFPVGTVPALSAPAETASLAGEVQAVYVATPSELNAAIAEAVEGTVIVLADGTYADTAFPIAGKSGSESKPIVIRAAHQGQAVIAGSSYFNVDKSSYVTIQGLKFIQDATTIPAAVRLTNSDHIRLTRNTFALTQPYNKNGYKWVSLEGASSHHNRIDHNEFGPRSDLGQMIAFQGSVMSKYDVIEYNYFHDSLAQPVNGGETIRAGLSGLSMTEGFATIQYNVFDNVDSDDEIVSVKSSGNTVRYNTFLNSKGQVTSRHGMNNSFYGNYFRGDGVKAGVGGFRIYGNDHKIYNNYMQNLTHFPIDIDSGDFDAGPDGSSYTSGDLSKHWRVYRALVVNNTIVDSANGITIGRKYDKDKPPVDSRVANNIVRNSKGTLYNERLKSNTVFEGNIGFGAVLSNEPHAPNEILNIDPALTEVDGLWKLSSSSPAIGAGAGGYPFVTDDFDGQPREAYDVGADEYSAAPVVRKALTPADVGPYAMTIAHAEGRGTNGWYTTDVTVALNVPDADYGAVSTMYRIDSQADWVPYTTPIVLKEEGKHTLYYRSVDAAGNEEPVKSLAIPIDKSAPVYQLSVNGTPVPSTASFPDDQPVLTLKLQAQDALSGLAKHSFTVTGVTYESQGVIDFAGLWGEQSVKVRVEDLAGNRREDAVTFRLVPTLSTLTAKLERYEASAELEDPLAGQLRNALKQAQHHKDKGSAKQAIKFLEEMLKHMDNKALAGHISVPAKQDLTSYVEALRAEWSK